ncbi:COP23 domain-containing protein [Roseofilum capinflatum]|uniref:COP23 domain-containing protein n=1 Tax=Roseofilum capinflatum BLCC-M114 TaxID=3022440 RepID=A0ABT7B967_9CYAN|nr:COP23 domain-containing protein [Roseofilum capinflatum]MDJ1175706.1 COP23 domain-containing protein [Roseofilum capinflatum BLCC-M114]
MSVAWTLLGQFFLNSSLYFLSIIAIISVGGCSLKQDVARFGANGTQDVPGYTTAEREAKFSTMESPFGEIQPLFVIYTSNTGKSYVWFMLRPLGIYSSEERSTIIVNNLETYRQEKMTEIAWGTLNGENIMCAYTEKTPQECQLILTLSPDVDADQVLYLLRCKLETPDAPACAEAIRS